MKTTIIHHNEDFDGIFCREIAKHFIGPGNESEPTDVIGWNFGDKVIPMPATGIVYIMDLPPECVNNQDFSRVIWIDHHKTSIEKWTPEFTPCTISGYRIDGVAACRLAWQWFIKGTKDNPGPSHGVWMPVKEDFVERRVNEPLAVRLAGEYDIWDKRDPDAETFQYALRASPITPSGWSTLLSENTEFVTTLLADGRTCQRYQQSIDADLVTTRSFRIKWEGLDFLCLNTGRFNSLTFAALDKPDTGHDALLGFNWNGKVWTVSLYHAKNKTYIEHLPQIAKKYGGVGHMGACGFTCDKLPFL